jgi:hypothetical protein
MGKTFRCPLDFACQEMMIIHGLGEVDRKPLKAVD